jgi:hypothetical protein
MVSAALPEIPARKWCVVAKPLVLTPAQADEVWARRQSGRAVKVLAVRCA